MRIKSGTDDIDIDMERFKRYNRNALKELLVIVVFSLVVFIIAVKNDVMEMLLDFARRHENLQIDEVFSIAIITLMGAVAFGHRRWRDVKILSEKLIERNRKLEEIMDQVQVLEGILPICSNCKRIRDRDEWQQMETYVSNHSHALFTHSLCPECARKLFPSLYGEGAVKKE